MEKSKLNNTEKEAEKEQTREEQTPEEQTREERMYRELGIGESTRVTVYIPDAKGEDALPIGLNGKILLYKRGETHQVPKEIFEIMQRGRALR